MNDFIITATTEQSLFFYLSFLFLGMLLCSLFIRPKERIIYIDRVVPKQKPRKVDLDDSDLSLVQWGKRKYGESK